MAYRETTSPDDYAKMVLERAKKREEARLLTCGRLLGGVSDPEAIENISKIAKGQGLGRYSGVSVSAFKAMADVALAFDPATREKGGNLNVAVGVQVTVGSPPASNPADRYEEK